MSCPYCTPMRDGETGESIEDCKEFVYIDNEHVNTLIRTFLWRDEDDGSWWRTVLMADEWKERKDISHFPVVTSFPAPPFCPHCGAKLEGGE